MNYQLIFDALDRSETLLNDLFQTPEEKKAHLELLTDIARSKDQVKDFIDGRSIAAIWSIDDVMHPAEVEPEADLYEDEDEDEEAEQREITEEDAINILGLVDRHHDASIGINWEVIKCHADMYFEEKEQND